MLYRERIVFRGIINIIIEYRTGMNQLVYTIKNTEDFSPELDFEKPVISSYQACSDYKLEESGCRYESFCILNLNVFWIPSPDKKFGQFKKK
jgi:hypothetical protein